MADTAAALVIQLSADFKQFQKEMRAATGVFDAEGRKIERRQKQLASNLQKGFEGLGKYIVGGAALYGLERYVSGLVEFGSQIKVVANATKIGTDEIQAFGLMAAKNSVDQESLNAALEKFSKNVGEAAIKGGDLLKFYKKLGVDVKGDPTQAFYQLADAVANTKSPQQQLNLTTTALGKSMGNLTPILAQGSKALKDQVEQLKATGQIASKDTISKLDEIGVAWINLKRQFTVTGANAFAEPLSELTKNLADPKIQSSLKQFATIMAELAIELAKVAKYAPVAVGAFAGFRLGRLAGPQGAIAGAVIGGVIGGSVGGVNAQTEDQLRKQIASVSQRNSGRPTSADKQEIARLQTVLGLRIKDAAAAKETQDALAKKPPTTGGQDRSDLLDQEAKRLQAGRDELANLAKQDAKSVRDETLKANQDIRQDNLDTLEARIQAIKAQDAALSEETRGTEEYAGIQKKVIEEAARLDINLINERKDADLKAIDERAKAANDADADARAARKRQLDELVLADKISPRQATSSLNIFDEAQRKERASREEDDASRRVALEQSTASQIVAINAKKASDLRQYDGSDLVRDAIAQGKEQVQQYQDETAQIGLTAGALAKLTFIQTALNEARRSGETLTAAQIRSLEQEANAVGEAAKKAHDAQIELNRSIEVTDELRSGLEDVGVAGLHGFDSMKDAAVRFIEQLAEMILRLGVLRPLLNGLLGEQGTLGSGPLGGIFSAGGGFFNTIANQFGAGSLALNTSAAIAANPLLFGEGGFTGQGGKDEPAGVVHKGEYVFDQKAVRRIGVPALRAMQKGYSDGGLVGARPQLPSLPSVVPVGHKGPSLSFFIDARYASRGVGEEIEAKLIKLAPIMVKAAVETSRKEFPSNLSNTLRDKA